MALQIATQQSRRLPMSPQLPHLPPQMPRLRRPTLMLRPLMRLRPRPSPPSLTVSRRSVWPSLSLMVVRGCSWCRGGGCGRTQVLRHPLCQWEQRGSNRCRRGEGVLLALVQGRDTWEDETVLVQG